MIEGTETRRDGIDLHALEHVPDGLIALQDFLFMYYSK
jgi:hypothetical protein